MAAPTGTCGMSRDPTASSGSDHAPQPTTRSQVRPHNHGLLATTVLAMSARFRLCHHVVNLEAIFRREPPCVHGAGNHVELVLRPGVAVGSSRAGFWQA